MFLQERKNSAKSLYLLGVSSAPRGHEPGCISVNFEILTIFLINVDHLLFVCETNLSI